MSEDAYWEYLRDMLSPADGEDLTDEELIALLRENARAINDERDCGP